MAKKSFKGEQQIGSIKSMFGSSGEVEEEQTTIEDFLETENKEIVVDPEEKEVVELTEEEQWKIIAEQIKANKPETKSKRLNLLIKPSLDKELGELSKRTGLSKNDIVNKAIEVYLGKVGK